MRFAPLLVAVLALSSVVGGAVVADPGSARASTAPTVRSGGVATAAPVTADPLRTAPPDSTPTPTVTEATPRTRRVAVDHSGNGTNQTHIVAIPPGAVQRSDLDRVVLNLGPATSFAAEASAIRMETRTLENRLAAAETDEARERIARQILDGIEQRADGLRRAERRAISRYNQGELTAETFAIRLAAIDSEAEALQARLDLVRSVTTEDDDFALDLAPVRTRLESLEGPVRDRAAAALQGEHEPMRFYVDTGPMGVALTTIEDRTYIREAFRGALWSPDNEASIAPETIRGIVATAYPTIWNNRQTTNAKGGATIGSITVTYPNGSLTAFVGAKSERVFKEYQRFGLDVYYSPAAANNTMNGLRMVVNRTYAGGPMRIHVVDAETGEPVDVTVTISQGATEGTTVGRTGADGTIWTLSPRGQFTVFAIQGSSAVFVETEPVPPPEVTN